MSELNIGRSLHLDRIWRNIEATHRLEMRVIERDLDLSNPFSPYAGMFKVPVTEFVSVTKIEAAATLPESEDDAA